MVKKKENLIVTTVFVDIEDSTGISNYLEKEKYENFLLSFHNTVKKVLNAKKWEAIKKENNHKFMGDEFIAFLPHSEYDDQALELSLQLAATLKYEWYFSAYNKLRLKGDKELIELNIGINTGDLSLMEYPVLHTRKVKKRYSYEGFPITLAKRIQSVAEESITSRVVVADRFFREYTRTKPRNYEFHYVGKKSFKGIAQRFSCYEWLGGDFYEYLFVKEAEENYIEDTLKALYDRNPQNPWYAALLAHYYYYLGEEEYYNKIFDNEYYKKCAKICIDSIQKISSVSKYNMRELNELLFVCLEVGEKWEELCFRADHAFSADSTFSGALALNAKSLYMLGGESVRKAKETAEKLISLFQQSLDYESLYDSHFLLARYYATEEVKRKKMIYHLKEAIKYAQRGEIDWAYVDYDISKADFENVKHDPEFKQGVMILEKMWERSQ
jgi:class 3 adenylate cyclase